MDRIRNPVRVHGGSGTLLEPGLPLNLLLVECVVEGEGLLAAVGVGQHCRQGLRNKIYSEPDPTV